MSKCETLGTVIKTRLTQKPSRRRIIFDYTGREKETKGKARPKTKNAERPSRGPSRRAGRIMLRESGLEEYRGFKKGRQRRRPI